MTGLVIRDTSGRVTLDMTMNISQLVGYVDTGGGNGAIGIPVVPSGKTPFYIVMPLVDLQSEKGKKPGVTQTNGSLSWSYSFSTSGWGYFAANCRIFYGYY
jgi:hypothetical protein